MLGRKKEQKDGRKPQKKRKWEEDDDEGKSEPEEITAVELEQWRKKEREEEEREERVRKRREKEEAERRRKEEKEKAAEETRKHEEMKKWEAEQLELQRQMESQKQLVEPAPAAATAAVMDINLGKRSACMVYLQHKQKDGPMCPKGDACPDRHPDDIQELLHWTKYFGDRHCKFGNACRLIPFCMYRHPPEATAQIREHEKRRAQASAQPGCKLVMKPEDSILIDVAALQDRRQLCMLHLQHKQRGAPACAKGAACQDRHTDDELELLHWAKYFGERPCKFGMACRLMPHCLYAHPMEAAVAAVVGAAAAGPEGGVENGLLQPCEDLPTQIPGSIAMELPTIAEDIPVRTVCVKHLQACLFGGLPCDDGESCVHLHPTDAAEITQWAELFRKIPCKSGSTCPLLPRCLFSHPEAVLGAAAGSSVLFQVC